VKQIKPTVIPAEDAVVVTVGVPHDQKDHYTARALGALERAGFQAGPTSDESILLLAERVQTMSEFTRESTDEHSGS
jgi:hypothetical protein